MGAGPADYGSMLAPLLTAVALVASSWGITSDPGVRMPDGVSTEAVASNGIVRAWVNTMQGMVAYRSSDGLSFSTAAGASTPGGADAAVVPVASGGWRMYYTQQTPAGKAIASAVSGDLLTWTPDPGVRLDLGTNRATGVPEAVVLPDGRVRLYYVMSGGFGPERIDSAVSADGLSFTQESGDRLTGGYVDPAVVRLADGTWLMVCSTSPSGQQRLYTATSTDGLTWAVSPTPLYAPTENVLDPTLLPLGGDRFRVYYSVAAPGQQLSGPFRVESGVLAPAPAKPVQKATRTMKAKHRKAKHKKKKKVTG